MGYEDQWPIWVLDTAMSMYWIRRGWAGHLPLSVYHGVFLVNHWRVE